MKKFYILILFITFNCAPTAKSLIQDAWQIGDKEKAIKLYKKALELESQNLDALMGLGYSYLQKSVFDSSIFYFEKSLKINPDYKPAYSGLISVYEEKGDYRKAIQYSKKLISLEPENTKNYNRISNQYFKTGEYNKSIEYSEKAIKLGDNSAFPEFQIAKCNLSLNKFKRAKDLYYQAWNKADSLNIGFPFPVINNLVTSALNGDTTSKKILKDVFDITKLNDLDFYNYQNNPIVKFVETTEKPVILNKPIPKYPQEAINNKVEGRVIVRVLVGLDGNVLKAYILNSSHPLLNKEALKAGYALRFKPGQLNGKTVKVIMAIPFDFRLN